MQKFWWAWVSFASISVSILHWFLHFIVQFNHYVDRIRMRNRNEVILIWKVTEWVSRRHCNIQRARKIAFNEFLRIQPNTRMCIVHLSKRWKQCMIIISFSSLSKWVHVDNNCAFLHAIHFNYAKVFSIRVKCIHRWENVCMLLMYMYMCQVFNVQRENEAAKEMNEWEAFRTVVCKWKALTQSYRYAMAEKR